MRTVDDNVSAEVLLTSVISVLIESDNTACTIECKLPQYETPFELTIIAENLEEVLKNG